MHGFSNVHEVIWCEKERMRRLKETAAWWTQALEAAGAENKKKKKKGIHG